jgi:hypothetical protein
MRQAAGKKGDRARRAGRRRKLHFAKRFHAKFRELSCAKSFNQFMRINTSILNLHFIHIKATFLKMRIHADLDP